MKTGFYFGAIKYEPEIGTEYWAPIFDKKGYRASLVPFHWYGDDDDKHFLFEGEVFLSEMDCIRYCRYLNKNQQPETT